MSVVPLLSCSRFRDQPLLSKSHSRLKVQEVAPSPITGDQNLRVIDGVWIPASPEASALFVPEQVRITCSRSEHLCHEIKAVLGQAGDLISIMSVEDVTWKIQTWNGDALTASIDEEPSASAASGRCQRHVLTLQFQSGTAISTDIPVGGPDCGMFKQANSYRLARGRYVVDLSPGNDLDRSGK